MINSVEVKNFRCFEQLNLSGLGRFNVVVGRNASGKTALLEALFTASGSSPELVLRTKGWRGMGAFGLINQRSPYEELWRDLFFRFDQGKPISIAFTGSSMVTRSLTISYQSRQDVLIPIPESTATFDASPIVPIVFEWADGLGKKATAMPLVTAQGLSIRTEGETVAMPAAFYSSGHVLPAQEVATNFSNFSIRNSEAKVVEAMRSEFKFIKSLSSESRPAGSFVYAQVEDLPEKLPINLLSTGVNKLMSLLLGIANQSGGVVYVDEIENGFYYSSLTSHLRLILRFCREFDVQLFASTHSRELLEALAEACKDNPDELTLIRSEIVNGKAEVQHFKGRSSILAMKKTEIR